MVVLEAHVVLVVALACIIGLRELQITRAVAGETSRGGVGESTDGVVLVVIGIHSELKKKRKGSVNFQYLALQLRVYRYLPLFQWVPNKNKSFVLHLY